MLYRKVVVSSIFSLILLTSDARASVIVNASVSGAAGTYSYSYEIANQSEAGILALSLTVIGDVDSVQAPVGWVFGTGAPAPGETLVQWVSTDVPYDVPAFGSLSGFLITSISGPGVVAFSTLDDNFGQFDGLTTGPVVPTAVPEPGNLISGGGVLLLAMWAFRRRRVDGSWPR